VLTGVGSADPGSDAGDGSLEDPWARVQTGLNRAQPGDSVVVHDGTYREPLWTVRGGSAAARITLRAENPGQATLLADDGRVMQVNHPYVSIEGLVFDGQYNDSDVIRVQSTADHLVFSNNQVRHGRRDGIDLGNNQDDGSLIGAGFDFLENVSIVDSTLHHFLNMDAGVRVDAHAIVAGGVRGLEIRNSQAYYVSGDALQLQDGAWDDVTVDSVKFWNGPLPEPAGGFPAGVNPGENGIDTKQDASISTRGRLTITGSEFFGWEGDYINNAAAVVLKERVEVVLDGNVFFDNEIAARLRGRPEDAGAHVTLVNGVFHGNAVAVRYEDSINNLHLLNNTFGDGHGAFLISAPSSSGAGDDFQLLNNLFLADAAPGQASDPSNLAVGPESFIDAALHDYHLRSGSAALDAGITIDEVAADRNGTPRPQGDAYDVGAYEGVGHLPPGIFGDADLDGDVDFGDYMILEASFGGPGGWEDGDFDFSGTVDFGDYMILEAAFGDTGDMQSAAPAANIPEPGTMLMLLAGMAGLCGFLRMRKRRRCDRYKLEAQASGFRRK